MDYGWNEEIADFRREVREFVSSYATPTLKAELDQRGPEGEGDTGPLMQAIHDELDRRGWLRIAWPEQYGGLGKSPWYQYTMVEEFSFGRIPYGGMSIGSVAPALMNFGPAPVLRRTVSP